MCYFIEIEIVPQKSGKNTAKSPCIVNKDGPLYINGNFPKFTITNGHCACDLVGKKGASLNTVDSYLAKLLNHEDIKRVKIIWFWGSEKPDKTSVEKLTLEEFNTRNHSRSLDENVWYSVNDPSKYIN